MFVLCSCVCICRCHLKCHVTRGGAYASEMPKLRLRIAIQFEAISGGEEKCTDYSTVGTALLGNDD